ncbi:MAG: divergent polysaccharide deacetylase family protein [Hyphomicrobiales bacterium]|nr:divergent polysaccharide deacetylase family protein [Hyphomicrobiales bacterium]
MTGNLDRPLGVPTPTSIKPARFGRHAVIAASVLAAGIVGYAAKGYIGSTIDRPDDKSDLHSALESSQINSQKSKTGNTKNNTVKRPDLPIDENAPGLRELSISDEMEIPAIIPRKRPDNYVKRQVLAHLPDPELVEKTSVGQLPVKSPDGLRALDIYSRQPDTEGNFGVARIVIIVGGLGISQTSTDQAIRTLPSGVTLAFAPYGNSLPRWMQTARKSGHELLMQIPMEPFGYPQTSAGARSLLSSADTKLNRENLYWSLGRITNYVGVMNYLGGKMLTSPEKLTPVFEELSDRGLMFVDDGSIRNSVATTVSKSTGLPNARAHMTIDSLRTRSAITKKLGELEETAKRTGLAIGVATAFPESITLIAKFLKNAKKRGLELTPVSAIASEPKG